MPESLTCPDHGTPLRLGENRWGHYYGCPEERCRVSVGCHKGTTKPLGTPAGPELKAARIRAHAAFDALWKGPGAKMRRKDAYRWLSERMGLDPSETHIGMFDAEQCELVTALVTLDHG